MQIQVVLEYNLSESVSNRPAFFVTNAIEYGIDDTTHIKKELIDDLLIYTLWYKFLNGRDAQSDIGNFFHKKAGPLEPF